MEKLAPVGERQRNMKIEDVLQLDEVIRKFKEASEALDRFALRVSNMQLGMEADIWNKKLTKLTIAAEKLKGSAPHD